MPYGPTTARPGLRVRVDRDAQGIIRRYSDPDTGRVLTRTDGIMRMSVDYRTGSVVDSFGNQVSMRELSLTRSEETRRFLNARQVTSPVSGDPTEFRPAGNEEVIERLIVAGKDGKVHKVDISYGAGRKFDPKAKGSAWRTKLSDALGVGGDERLPTTDLQRAVLSREIVVRRTT